MNHRRVVECLRVIVVAQWNGESLLLLLRA